MNYTSNIKENKHFSLAKSVVYNFVLAAFITLALAVGSIYIFKIRLDVVLSDSMTPTIYTDDIVIIMPFDDYDVGDIIEYQHSSTADPTTHRIMTKVGSGINAVYTTQGDANPAPDQTPVTHNEINGKVISIVEDGKLIYDFVKKNYFLFIDILLGMWVLSSTISLESEIRKHNIAKSQ